YKTFRCLNCDWLMWKTMASRQFEPEEVHELLAKGRVGPLQGFRSKMGRPFEAVVKLGAEKKPLFDCGENGLDAEQKIDTEKLDASEKKERRDQRKKLPSPELLQPKNTRTAGTRFGSCPLKLRRRNIGSPACSLLRFL